MDSLKEVISNLKFLGSLKPNDKFNSRFLYIQPEGIYTRLSRTFLNYDNRNNALKFIEETINKSFDVLNCYELSPKQSDKAMCENIIKDLLHSKAGITSLKLTYIDDIRFGCDIDTILQILDSKMLDIKSKHPGLVISILSPEISSIREENIEDKIEPISLPEQSSPDAEPPGLHVLKQTSKPETISPKLRKR